MKKTYSLADRNYSVEYASAMSSGYGHQRITVGLTTSDGDYTTFVARVDDMFAYEEANALEGQAKYEAFYQLIARKIEDRVHNWLIGDDY